MARAESGRREPNRRTGPAPSGANGPSGGPPSSSAVPPDPAEAPEAFGRGEAETDSAAAPQRPAARPRREDRENDPSGNGHGDAQETSDREQQGRDLDYRGGEEDNQPAKPPFYKRPLVLVIGGLVLLAVIGVGIWYWLYSRQFEKTDDAFIDAHITAVSPRVAGQVIDLGPDVDDNRPVKAGQLLVQIDPADFKQKVTSAEAGVMAAKGKAEQARAQQKVAEAQAASARADVLTAEANQRMTASDLERYTKLDPRAVSRQALDNAKAAAASAQANLEAMQKKADAADAQVKLAATQIATAEADEHSAEAALSNAKLQESYTTITAPLAGRITRKDVEKGAYVQAGQALMSIVPHEVYVTANFKETQLAHMKPGDRVDIEVDAFPDRKLHGHVDSIQKGSGARFSLLPPENATGNYVKVVQRVPVKIVLDGGEDLSELGPGMSVTPKVWISR